MGTYRFVSSTGTLILSGRWSSNNFQRLLDNIGVSQIKKIIVDNTCTLHTESIPMAYLVVARNGYVSAAYCHISRIENDGIIRIRHVTATNVVNDGQFYATTYSRLRGFENKRHLCVSQTSVYKLTNGIHASVKATSSWFSECRAVSNTSLCLGSSHVIHSSGVLAAWSKPTFNEPGFNYFTNDAQLLFTALDVLSKVDYIDSQYVYTDADLFYEVCLVAHLLNQDAILPYDIAKEFASRIEFPGVLFIDSTPTTAALYSGCDFLGATDRLRWCVGTHRPPAKYLIQETGDNGDTTVVSTSPTGQIVKTVRKAAKAKAASKTSKSKTSKSKVSTGKVNPPKKPADKLKRMVGRHIKGPAE